VIHESDADERDRSWRSRLTAHERGLGMNSGDITRRNFLSSVAHRLLPTTPYELWVSLFTVLVTALNLTGATISARIDTLLVVAMRGVIGTLLVSEARSAARVNGGVLAARLRYLAFLKYRAGIDLKTESFEPAAVRGSHPR
jgi:hypothetical protein